MGRGLCLLVNSVFSRRRVSAVALTQNCHIPPAFCHKSQRVSPCAFCVMSSGCVMYRYVSRFIRDEAGAITIDWIVFTAGILTIIVALMGLSLSAPTSMSEGQGSTVLQQTVDG